VTELVFNLTRFSFKREIWENHLNVDISENRCAVLTGLNAGGKTLVMATLEKFCDTIINPDKRKLRSLKNLVQGAGIESLKVRFEYGFLDSRGKEYPSDASKIPWIRIDDEVYFYEDPMSDFLNFGHEDWPLHISRITGSVIVEFELESIPGKPDRKEKSNGREDTILSSPRVTIRRRDGISLSISGINDDKTSSRESDCTVWDEWGGSLDVESWSLDSGLRSFGPRQGDGDAWKSEIRDLTGLNFQEAEVPFVTYADDYYQYDNPDRLIRFDANLPILHSISEAYSLTAGETIEDIQNKVGIFDDDFIELEQMMGEIFIDIWKDRLEQWERNDPEMIAKQYDAWKETSDLPFPAASDKGITRALSKFTDILDLTNEDYPLRDSEHFKSLLAMYYAQNQLLGADELEDCNKPEHYFGFISENHDALYAPIPKNFGIHSSSKMKSHAIEADPEIGVWLALQSFIEEFGDLRIPSSGQLRILAIFSALSEMKPGSTIMIDEPELSLHINWQERLISTLISSLPHLQFLLATHSPHVIINHTEAIYEVPPRDEV